MLGQEVCGEGIRVKDALQWAIRLLAAKGHESPRLDAEVLLGHVTGYSRSQLVIHRDACLPSDQAEAFRDLVRRRLAYEPVAYLVGERGFWDVDLYVDSRVLIPRPETELLAQEALAWVRRQARTHPRVADVGTGSGALAVVLARELADARVHAVDISLDALTIARRNIVRYGLGQRVSAVCSDLLSALQGPFDVVMANLPYIRRDALPTLAPDVRDYEPRLALVGGIDGLQVIERLLAQLPERLAETWLVLLEIDPEQVEPLLRAVEGTLPACDVHVLPDLAGLARVLRIASCRAT
ncbi:MAG: peptide chain release factor N(5)-glutamine methyltransferase [Anaerolineae bacterium]